MRRISMMISAIVNSATERVLENGALKTGMPIVWQAARSTWLVPTEKQPIATTDLMPSMTSAVICVRERMPSRRMLPSASRSAVPSSAFARRSISV